MQKNPYISLLNLMEQVSRSSNSPSIQIGEILQSPPDIQVKYNGIVLTKEELWISHYLLAGQPGAIWYRLRRTGQAAAGMRPTSRITTISITTTPIQ